MCTYDDMDIQLIQHSSPEILHILYFKKRSHQNGFNSFKRKQIKHLFVVCRLCIFIYLLVSPASGLPLSRHRKSSSKRQFGTLQLTKSDPREGIGIHTSNKSEKLWKPISTTDSTHSWPSLEVPNDSPSDAPRTLSLTDSSKALNLTAEVSVPTVSEELLSTKSAKPLVEESTTLLFSTAVQSGGRSTTFAPLNTLDKSHFENLLLEARAPPPSSHQKAREVEDHKEVLSSSLEMSEEVVKSDGEAGGRSRRAPSGEATSTSCGGDSSRDGGPSAADWMEPCRNHDLIVEGDASPSDLAHHIVKAIHDADAQVDSFINDFSQEIFGVSWVEATSKHEPFVLPFLNTSAVVDLEDLARLSFSDALQESYEVMQRRAVGIEQVTLDQALYQSNCLTRFRQLEMRIINILCQMRHAMLQLNITPRENVTGDIMPESERCISSTIARQIRDAIILREYMSSLNLLHSVFTHFLSNEQ